MDDYVLQDLFWASVMILCIALNIALGNIGRKNDQR